MRTSKVGRITNMYRSLGELNVKMRDPIFAKRMKKKRKRFAMKIVKRTAQRAYNLSDFMVTE